MRSESGCLSHVESAFPVAPDQSRSDQAAILRLRLFGYPEATLDNRPLRFTRRASLALLAYLAMNRKTHRRTTIAKLIGNHMSDSQRQLRNVLADLHTQLGDVLLVTPQTIALSQQCDIISDITLLEEAVRVAEQCHTDTALRDAVEQYRHPFLDGFVVNTSQAFDEWQDLERQRLHSLIVRAFELLYRQTMASDTAASLSYVNRLLMLEPWHERAHHDSMLMLASIGQRGSALGQYEVCRRVLSEEFDAAPDQTTTALYQRLRDGLPLASNLEPEQSLFVGRSQELSRLAAFLHAAEPRLLIITGPSGIGKTCLALHAATGFASCEPSACWRRFPDGVWWVNLDTLERRPLERDAHGAARIYAAIARALNLAVPSQAQLEQTVLEYLCHRSLLLVLDNIEHIPGAELVIEKLVASTRRPSVLATTCRTVTNGSTPVLQLEPMSISRNTQAIEQSDAGALFLSQARQMHARFAPTDADRAAIVRICVATHGLPLAIVHAAQKLRTMSCHAIATHLEQQGMASLGTPLHNLPTRHRTMAANIEYGRAFRTIA